MAGAIRRLASCSPERLRELFEPHCAGGWWRRDTILEALEIAYPHWLTATEVRAICCVLRPDYRAGDSKRDARTARSLGRLHGLRMVDRYGEPHQWIKGATGVFRKALCREGFRYRIVKDATDLL